MRFVGLPGKEFNPERDDYTVAMGVSQWETK